MNDDILRRVDIRFLWFMEGLLGVVMPFLWFAAGALFGYLWMAKAYGLI